MSIIIFFSGGPVPEAPTTPLPFNPDTDVPSGSFGDYGCENNNAAPEPSNYLLCDRTNFRVRRGGLVRTWDGLLVRPKSWEPRHPQDFVRGRSENIKGSERPEPQDIEREDAFPNGVGLDDLDP